mmetsp:Transcript_72662/g.128076  ORF Transcript_72662/g.128076 Transcript_72662/m.128076 type:complete len:115 (+) Transcript_72662:196-540(+)
MRGGGLGLAPAWSQGTATATAGPSKGPHTPPDPTSCMTLMGSRPASLTIPSTFCLCGFSPCNIEEAGLPTFPCPAAPPGPLPQAYLPAPGLHFHLVLYCPTGTTSRTWGQPPGY